MSKLFLYCTLLQANGNPVPDGVFYYTVTILLAGALIFIIWHFANKLTTTLDALKITVNELVTMTKVHEEKHKQHERKLEELAKKKRV